MGDHFVHQHGREMHLGYTLSLVQTGVTRCMQVAFHQAACRCCLLAYSQNDSSQAGVFHSGMPTAVTGLPSEIHCRTACFQGRRWGVSVWQTKRGQKQREGRWEMCSRSAAVAQHGLCRKGRALQGQSSKVSAPCGNERPSAVSLRSACALTQCTLAQAATTTAQTLTA